MSTAESSETVAKRVRNEASLFITTWQTSASVQEVADKLGLKKGSAAARATKFRKELNISLKNMPKGGGRKLNVEALRALAISSVA